MVLMTLEELGTPTFAEGVALRLAGTTAEYTMDEIGEIPKQWQSFVDELETVLPGTHATYGVVRGERGRPMRYTCAVDASEIPAPPPAWETLDIAPQLYAVFTGRGGAELIRRMWASIWQVWLPSSGRTPVEAPMLEFYADRFTQESGGLFEIRIPVQPV